VLEDDPVAWSELLDRFRGLLYRCITKAVGRTGSCLCEDDLDEIFCELCLNLWRDDKKKLRAYDPERGVKLSTWLGLLAINTAYDHLRRRARYPLLAAGEDRSPDPADAGPGPLERLIAGEERALLQRLLGRLSDRDRRFVQLYYGSGLEAEHIAEQMHISVKTVYTKKHKIEARLGRFAREDRPAAA
jgi:RNA polymerase sigma-70 factor (ECF subfamily)